MNVVPKYKEIYDELKKSGDLSEMFPFLTGSWSKDKAQFIRIQENPTLFQDDFPDFESDLEDYE